MDINGDIPELSVDSHDVEDVERRLKLIQGVEWLYNSLKKLIGEISNFRHDSYWLLVSSGNVCVLSTESGKSISLCVYIARYCSCFGMPWPSKVVQQALLFGCLMLRVDALDLPRDILAPPVSEGLWGNS